MGLSECFLDEVLKRLSGLKQLKDGSWMALCPAHDDTRPSLHISVSEGKVLIHCFAGCSFEKVLRALGLEGREEEIDPSSDKIEAIYVYTDEFGQPLFRKLRLRGKNFKIQGWDGENWVSGYRGRTVIYRLPEVLAAERVIIVEGEKDVETLRGFGFVATTNPHGASEALKDEYREPFEGKDVILIPDHDKPGLQLGERWLELLRGHAKSISRVFLPPGFKDVTEFLEKHSLDALRELIDKAVRIWPLEIKKSIKHGMIRLEAGSCGLELEPPLPERHGIVTSIRAYEKPGNGNGNHDLLTVRISLTSLRAKNETAAHLERIAPSGSWRELLEVATLEAKKLLEEVESLTEEAFEAPESQPFLLAPFVTNTPQNFIYGPPGSGKSFLALFIAKAVIEGKPLRGTELFDQGPVVYADWETSPGLMRDRIKALGFPESVREHFHAIFPTAPFNSALSELARKVEATKAKLLIIDSLGPASPISPLDPLAPATMKRLLKFLEVPVLIIAHPPKNVQVPTIYGSVYWEAFARNIVEIRPLSADDEQICFAAIHRKCSFGQLYFPSMGILYFGDPAELYFEPLSGELYPELMGRTVMEKVQYLVSLEPGLTKREIAERLGVNLSTIKTELWRLVRKGLVIENGGRFYPKS